MPCSDLVGVGRAGAGFDVFGRGKFDLTLGLWIGAAGEWDEQHDMAVLYATPTIGTENRHRLSTGAISSRSIGGSLGSEEGRSTR
jgi:hypothetical protein